MGKVAKSPRIKGEVPAGYDGPVYHRVAHEFLNHEVHSKFRFSEDERIETLLSGRNRDFHILRSGIVFDAAGVLRPEWHEPLKGYYVRDGLPDRFQIWFETEAWRVSKQVHDAIVALEPDRHVFLPIDVETRAGTRREYLHFMTQNYRLDEEIMHREKMQFRQRRFPDGRIGWWNREWLRTRDQSHPFGWLDGRATEGLHLFSGESLDNAWVVSPALFARLASLGDVLAPDAFFVPMGTCRDDQSDYSPPVIDPYAPPKRSLLTKLATVWR